MQTWFLELDRLLGRIERATTHYETLNLQRSASREDVLAAYQQTLEQLFPSYQISGAFPPDLRARLDRSFGLASAAFSVLADCSRRMDYDGTLSAVFRQPLPAPEEQLEVRNSIAQPEAFSLAGADEEERRRCSRLKITLPVRVTGHEQESGQWHEMSETIDASRTGVVIHLKHRVRHNRILHLMLPLPVKLRAHGFAETAYSVYAIVRRVIPLKDGVRAVGLEFIGAHPPAGWLDKPWAACRTKQWQSVNRRRTPRLSRTEPVTIEFLNEEQEVIATEQAVTESTSRGGARVRLETMPASFDLLRVTFTDHKHQALAIVVNQYVGKDGAVRAHLWFVEDDQVS